MEPFPSSGGKHAPPDRIEPRAFDLLPSETGEPETLAHRLDDVVDRSRRDARDVCLLDHRRRRLLGHAARLQEARKVRALPELRDAQLGGAGARLPVPVPVAVALGRPKRVLLAIGGAGSRTHLHLHQPLGGKADHLAQEIGIRCLLHERAQVHHVVGHR
jgi:hypothetical protein